MATDAFAGPQADPSRGRRVFRVITAVAIALVLVAGTIAAVWHGRDRLRDAATAAGRAGELSKQLRASERIVRPGDRSVSPQP